MEQHSTSLALLREHPAHLGRAQLRDISRALASQSLTAREHYDLSTRITVLHAQYTQILFTEAIYESRLRDAAAEALTPDEYARFDRELGELHALHRQAQTATLRLSYGHMLAGHANSTPTFMDDVEAGANAVLGFLFGKRK